MGRHLSVVQRRQARRLDAEGLKVAEIARELGCSLTTVNRVLAGKGKREETRDALVAVAGAVVEGGA